MSKKVMLVIMDGWGLGLVPASDAIQQAKVPFVTSLYKHYPNATLVTCGEAVGLPEGQMGNSEVGHLILTFSSFHAKLISLFLSLYLVHL
jgi:2,3-bisphosphoglycerate-independent phosphoglycerate mutase